MNTNHLRGIGGRIIGSGRSSIDKIVSRNTYRIEDTIIISGPPRSGTTWLMEILSSIPEYKSIFEPLNYFWYPEVNKTRLTSRIFIQPHVTSQNLKEYFQMVFTGKIKTLNEHYTLNIPTIYQRYRSTKILVKFIRANRLLPWISNNFQLRKILLITRHPCSTINSQINACITGYNNKYGYNYLPSKEEIILEISTGNLLDEDMINKIRNVNDMIGILSVILAIDYFVPFSYSKQPNWLIIKYEDIVMDGYNELIKIYNELKESDHVIKAFSKLKQPSMTAFTKNKSTILDSGHQLNKWKNKLNKRQINRIHEIFNWFNLSINNNDYKLF